MSTIRANTITDTAGTGAPNFPNGLSSSGVTVSGVPSGAVATFAMNTAPTGWIKANGAAISRTTYAALFTAIGTTFGVGDGSTTFNVPDLRGEFIRGWDDARGIDSGRVFGSAQTDQMQQITGYFANTTGPFTNQAAATSGAFAFTGESTASNASNSGAQALKRITFDSANSPSARTGAETRSRNIALLACIKY